MNLESIFALHSTRMYSFETVTVGFFVFALPLGSIHVPAYCGAYPKPRPRTRVLANGVSKDNANEFS
jgi:hypothetical protein